MNREGNTIRAGRFSRSAGVRSLGLLLAFGVAAASAEDTSSESQGGLVFEEITVTARFREETAQDIGGGISAMDDAVIERQGIVDFEDIARRIPGLNHSDRGPNQNDVGIRGISNGAQAGVADQGLSGPLVSQFLDDIPTAASTGSQRDFNLFDFERVEVLRGPQPTFFGEGSVGGTIRYATRTPDLSGDTISDSIVKAGLSSTQDGGSNYSISAASSLILSETFGIRAVVNQRDDDGFIDSIYFGEDNINDYEASSFRLVTLFEPTDELSVRFMTFQGSDETGDANRVAAAPFDPADLVSNASIDGNNKDDFEIYSLNVGYDFESFTLSSITGFFTRDSSSNFLCAGCKVFGSSRFLAPLPPRDINPNLQVDIEDRSFTQEFRVVSQLDGPLSYITGLYYQDTDLDTSNFGTAVEFLTVPGFAASGGEIFDQRRNAQSEQYSAFVELTYELSERLRLIGGVRYVDEEIVVDTIAAGSVTATPGGPIYTDVTDVIDMIPGISNEQVFRLEKFLPRVAFEYDLAEDVMIYGTVATGARNGNLNSSSSAFVASVGPTGVDAARFNEVRAFSQDEVTSYELGAKTRLADGDVTLNVAAYLNKFEDPQVQVSIPLVMLANAPDVEILGLELETLWRINDNWGAYLSAAYQESEFQDDFLLNPANPFNPGMSPDLAKGNQNSGTPEWSGSVGVDVAYPVGEMMLASQLSYTYTGSRFNTVANFPSSEMEALGIVNLRVGLEGDSWSLYAYANNLTNEIEYTNISGDSSIPMLNADGVFDFVADDVAVNRPRTVGVEAIFRF